MDPPARRPPARGEAVPAAIGTPPARTGGARVHPVPPARRHPHWRRGHASLVRRRRVCVCPGRHRRHGRLRRVDRGRVRAARAGRRPRSDRVAGTPALVVGLGGNDRHLVGRVQRAADRGQAATGVEGRDLTVLHRRPLPRRRALHRRLPQRGEPGVGWLLLHDERLSARPRHRRQRSVARDVATPHRPRGWRRPTGWSISGATRSGNTVR